MSGAAESLEVNSVEVEGESAESVGTGSDEGWVGGVDLGGDAELAEAEERGVAEAVFGVDDSTSGVGRLIERAEGGFSSGWSWLDSRCGLGAGVAGGSGWVDGGAGVGVVAEDTGLVFGSGAEDFRAGVGGFGAGVGGVGLVCGFFADGAFWEVAEGEGDEGEEPGEVSDGWGGDEDAEDGAELIDEVVGVAEGSDAVAVGEGWPEGAGNAVGGSGVVCDGGAIAVGSRATSRRARTDGRETGSTTRGFRGRGSSPESLARVSGAKLVAVEEVVEARTGAEFRPIQSSARPTRASATRDITTKLRRWPDS